MQMAGGQCPVQIFNLNGQRIIMKMHILISVFSWGDITESLIFEDGMMLVVGFLVMFVYISIMIGRFNMVEQRVRFLY